MDEKEINFIAKRYQDGKFSVDKGWKRLNIKPISRWKRIRIAASIACVIVLSATAAVIYHQYSMKTEQAQSTKENIEAISPIQAVKIIDFECSSLPDVISEIKEVYGVEVVNLPENAEEYHLSLHYEGNAADLVATINDILGTQMIVKE